MVIGLHSALLAYRWYGFLSRPTRPVIRRELKTLLRNHFAERIIEIGGGTSMMRSVVPPTSLFVSSDIAPTDRTGIVCDAQAAPFKDGSFDLCLAFEVVEHIADTSAVLSESHRCLAPGGFLMISIPFMYGIHDVEDHYRFTPLGIEGLLQRHGFEVVRIRRIGGTFTTVFTLLSNWMRRAIVPRRHWRAVAKGDRARLAIATLLLAPMTPLVWLGFLSDALFDRRSDSPTGLIAVARRTSVSC